MMSIFDMDDGHDLPGDVHVQTDTNWTLQFPRTVWPLPVLRLSYQKFVSEKSHPIKSLSVVPAFNNRSHT